VVLTRYCIAGLILAGYAAGAVSPGPEPGRRRVGPDADKREGFLAFSGLRSLRKIPEKAWASIPDELDAAWIRAFARVARNGSHGQLRRVCHEYARRRKTANPILERMFADPDEPNRHILLILRTTDSSIAAIQHVTDASPAVYFNGAQKRDALSFLVDAFADDDPRVVGQAAWFALLRTEEAGESPEGAARYEGFDWGRLEKAALSLLGQAPTRARRDAAAILGRRRCEEARELIKAMAESDEDDGVRAMCVRALSGFRACDEAFRLLSAATRDGSHGVRFHAIQALRKYGERGEAVVRSLPKDPHHEVEGVRRMVLRMLDQRRAWRERMKARRADAGSAPRMAGTHEGPTSGPRHSFHPSLNSGTIGAVASLS
jgi:hypothetical protein